MYFSIPSRLNDVRKAGVSSINRRLVKFEVKDAFVEKFTDKGLTANSSLVIQIKSEEWGGEWIDVDNSDKSVLKVFAETEVSPDPLLLVLFTLPQPFINPNKELSSPTTNLPGCSYTRFGGWQAEKCLSMIA